MKKNRPGMKPNDKRTFSKKETPQETLNFFIFLRERNPRLFAHHPDHPVFQNHVWTYHGLYFCKGCVMTFAGILFGAVFSLLSGWLKWYSEIQIGFIFLAMLLPSVVTSLMNLPRIAKHVARFLLGILMASAIIMIFITDSWTVRLAIVGTFLLVRTPLERKRKRDNETLIRRFSSKAPKKARAERAL
jgi:hypothetical protein